MKVTALPIEGAFLVEVEPHLDERGLFARTFCADELGRAGLVTHVEQQSVSWNERAGSLRGMHWQAEPHGEEKLVRCTAGRAFDVLVDVRPASPTYRVATTVLLDAATRNAVYIPREVAHGFLTLEDGTELLYQMSTRYDPGAQRGLRWDDPGLDVAWPVSPSVLSERDRSFGDHRW